MPRNLPDVFSKPLNPPPAIRPGWGQLLDLLDFYTHPRRVRNHWLCCRLRNGYHVRQHPRRSFCRPVTRAAVFFIAGVLREGLRSTHAGLNANIADIQRTVTLHAHYTLNTSTHLATTETLDI